MAVVLRVHGLPFAGLAAVGLFVGTNVSPGEIGGIEEPLLPYSTLLNGGFTDQADAVAVGPNGVIWVAMTGSVTKFDARYGTPDYYGDVDVFVARIDAATHTVLSTFQFGGSRYESVSGLAVDAEGNAYLAGETASADLPNATGQLGNYDYGTAHGSFVARLLPDGSGVAWAYAFGGHDKNDGITGICVTADGDPVVVGTTYSRNFPLVAPLAPAFGGGGSDAFVVRLHADGTGPVFSTYLGGSSTDTAIGVCLAPDGAIVVAGESRSDELMGTAAQIVGAPSGGASYLAEFEPSGTSVRRVGRMPLQLLHLVSGAGRLVLTGDAYPSDGLPGAVSPPYDWDAAFVLALDASTWEFLGGTHIGSSWYDVQTYSAAVAPDGTVWVAGYARGTSNVPVPGAVRPQPGDDDDAYVAAFEASGFSQVFGTYLGGDGPDFAIAVAVDADGSAWVAGRSDSLNFPLAHAVLPDLDGIPVRTSNSFVAQFRAGDPANRPAAVQAAAADVLGRNSVRVQWTPGDGAATSFAVDCSEVSDSGSVPGWTRVAIVSSEVSEWIDSDVGPDRKFRYSVQAVNSAGGSPTSSPMDAAVPATLDVSIRYGMADHVRRRSLGYAYYFGMVRLRGHLGGGAAGTPDLPRDGLRVIAGELNDGDELLSIPPGDPAWHKRPGGILRWRRGGARTWVDFDPHTGAFDVRRMTRRSGGVYDFLSRHWTEQRRLRFVVGSDVGSTAATWREAGRQRIRTP